MGRQPKFQQATAVDSAMGVFWRQGYAGTSPQALVDELGIGKGSLYNTFDSKHNLFTLALQGYSAKRLETLTARLSEPEAIRPALRAALTDLTGVGSHRRGCLMVNTVCELAFADATVAELGQGLFGRIEAAFRDAIERGQRSGELRAGDPSAAAGSLLTTAIGASVLARAGADEEWLSRLIDTAIERL
ncbi:MAG TPA: TetR/AcrR family transcriptional regulator [Trebonia sp.]|nr:TetR/AcrR family transcriptional regulator [Trebonia sp.]